MRILAAVLTTSPMATQFVVSVPTCTALPIYRTYGLEYTDIRNAPSDVLSEAALSETFGHLAQQWRKETAAMSLTSQKVSHPAYLRVIALGEPVLPLIFKSMRQQPAQWMVALQAITGENPVAKGSTVSEAAKAWLSWGAEHGHNVA